MIIEIQERLLNISVWLNIEDLRVLKWNALLGTSEISYKKNFFGTTINLSIYTLLEKYIYINTQKSIKLLNKN